METSKRCVKLLSLIFILKCLSKFNLSFQLSVESNLHLLWFCFIALCDWLKIWRHFLDQSELKPKSIVTCTHWFSRAWRRIHVFDSSSDWLIVLLACVVIGQSNYFCFGFTTQLKTPLNEAH